MGFAKFMSGSLGRGARVAVGIVLILVGLFSVQGVGGIVLAVVGAVALLAGALNFCLVGPLLGAPLKGSDLN